MSFYQFFPWSNSTEIHLQYSRSSFSHNYIHTTSFFVPHLHQVQPKDISFNTVLFSVTMLVQWMIFFYFSCIFVIIPLFYYIHKINISLKTMIELWLIFLPSGYCSFPFKLHYLVKVLFLIIILQVIYGNNTVIWKKKVYKQDITGEK